ncbi:hypothetical protein J437_LFUL009394 [Ladona fulva]|uniref:Cytochrome P450 n=1 Tax=Ladona fulva TaxID=123851 RepID=A0A8K0P0P1_LADFU|nr:hypothetical protein J437_LFUL009394 [Ladona fulva]
MHPPAGTISRFTVEDYQIPGTSLKIDKNIPIFISISAIQRDEKFFPRPEQFDPDRFLQKDQWNHFTYMPFGEGPRLCIGLKFTMDESYVFFRNFVQEIMKKREEAIDKGEGSGYGDFIHQLVLLKKRGIKREEIKNDDEDEENEFLKSDANETDVSWANVDLDDLAAQAMLFFSAGFETTSSLLSFAMFELSSSKNGKQIQRRVAEEVDKVIKEDGGMITYDGLKRMHLLDRVLNETLRLHPPAGTISRFTVEDYQIPGTSLKIDKNIPIFISISAIQRDEKFFPRPEQFDPDRFLQKDQWNHFTYMPFGEGPRLCIGQRFAMMQARLGLAALISKFEFDLCTKKTPVPLKYNKKAFILAPQSGVWLKTKLRRKKK